MVARSYRLWNNMIRTFNIRVAQLVLVALCILGGGSAAAVLLVYVWGMAEAVFQQNVGLAMLSALLFTQIVQVSLLVALLVRKKM